MLYSYNTSFLFVTFKVPFLNNSLYVIYQSCYLVTSIYFLIKYN